MIGKITFVSKPDWVYRFDATAVGTRRHMFRVDRLTGFNQYAGISKDIHDGFCLSCPLRMEFVYRCQECATLKEFMAAYEIEKKTFGANPERFKRLRSFGQCHHKWKKTIMKGTREDFDIRLRVCKKCKEQKIGWN